MKVTKEYCDLCGEQINGWRDKSSFMIHKVIQTRFWFSSLGTERAQDYVICNNCACKLFKWIEENKKK